MSDDPRKSNISENSRNNVESRILDPNLVRLEMARQLALDPLNDLTELSDDEIIDFCLIESLHELKVLDFSPVLKFYGFLKRDRPSLNRKRTDEYLKGLIGQISGQVQPMAYYGAPGTVMDEKPGFFDKINPWSKNK